MKRLSGALLALPRRWRALVRSGQPGQALTESSILLLTLLVMTAVGARALNRNYPDAMNMLDIYMRGFYFTLSLPFP